MKNNRLFIIWLIQIFSFSALSNVIGYIDQVEDIGGQIRIRGWACEIGLNQSIKIDLYASNGQDSDPTNNGVKISVFDANKKSEDAVSNASNCNTQFNKHRFRFTLNESQWTRAQNKNVYLRAFSKNKSAIIYGSGNFKIPRKPKLISQESLNKNSNFTIPDGESYIIDKSFSVRNLTVNGNLYCSNDFKSQYIKVSVDNLMVHGKFICGTKRNRYQGKIDFVFNEDAQEMMSMGKMVFGAMMQGEIYLHGRFKTASAKLTRTASKGSRYIYISSQLNWSPGDEIAISSSGFDMNETERRIIKKVYKSEKKIELDRPLSFLHFGKSLNYKLNKDGSEVTRKYDARTTVSNLSRSISIYPSGSKHLDTKIGIHMMMMDNSKAYIDNIHIAYGGQQGILGRYPFHWHLMGNVRGQYFSNSSITNSYQRCVVIHGTNYASVKYNSCVDHFGHGYFLEDGSERKNTIVGNVAMLSRKVPKEKALLESDFTGVARRFPAPSSFWISNPDNQVIANTSAGSEGTGFWMSFENKEICNKDMCSTPARTDTWEFRHNIAHSNKVGFTWDGAPGSVSTNNLRNSNDRKLISAHYRPTTKPTFSRLTAFKSSEAAIYFRGDSATFVDSLVADSVWGLFFAYSQEYKDSVIVGMSDNFSEKDKDLLSRKNSNLGGVILYDGPFELDNVLFADFPEHSITHNLKNITIPPFKTIGGSNKFINRSRKLQFLPEPYEKIRFMPENDFGWIDSRSTNFLEDIDGTMGMGGAGLIAPKNGFLYDNTCRDIPNTEFMNCDFQPSIVRIMDDQNRNHSKTFMKVTSPKNDILGALSDISFRHSNKFPVISGDNGTYEIQPGQNFENRRSVIMSYYSDTSNDISPTLKLNSKRGCVLDGINGSENGYRVNSLDQLRSSNRTSYFHNNGNTYMRLKVDKVNPTNQNASMGVTYSGTFRLNCLN